MSCTADGKLFNHIIKWQSYENCRNTGHYNLKPQYPFILVTKFLHKGKNSSGYCRLAIQNCLFFCGDRPYIKRPQFIPVKNYYCQNCSQLDHYKKQILKFLCYIQLQKLIHKDHMSCTADGKPLCDSLHNTKENNLQHFKHIFDFLSYSLIQRNDRLSPM